MRTHDIIPVLNSNVNSSKLFLIIYCQLCVSMSYICFTYHINRAVFTLIQAAYSLNLDIQIFKLFNVKFHRS